MDGSAPVLRNLNLACTQFTETPQHCQSSCSVRPCWMHWALQPCPNQDQHAADTSVSQPRHSRRLGLHSSTTAMATRFLITSDLHQEIGKWHDLVRMVGQDICYDGRQVGSPDILRFIQEKQPLLGCSGHEASPGSITPALPAGTG
jgi:hypothetical protein